MSKNKSTNGARSILKRLFILALALTAMWTFAALAEDVSEETESETEEIKVEAYAFELKDQFGETHKMEDYKGKVVFLNIWATWCGPCRNEMPDIQALYEKYKDSDDVAILGVAFPGLGGEKDAEGVAAFLEENGYTYPVLMDEQGELMDYYQTYSYPTTFMIDKEGYIYGYVMGAISGGNMENIIALTLEDSAE